MQGEEPEKWFHHSPRAKPIPLSLFFFFSEKVESKRKSIVKIKLNRSRARKVPNATPKVTKCIQFTTLWNSVKPGLFHKRWIFFSGKIKLHYVSKMGLWMGEKVGSIEKSL